MKIIRIKSGLIEGKERLKLYFDYDKEVIEQIKTIPGARWHPGEKCWHISVLAGGVEKLNRLFQGKLLFEMDCRTVGLYDGKIVGREDCRTVGLYDGKTVGREDGKTNSPVRDARTVEKEDNSKTESHRDDRMIVPAEFIKTMKLKNYSPNTVRTYYIQRPKKEWNLPNVLSEKEVWQILSNTENLKHKAILSLIYSAGLRRSELINMKIEDIDSKRMYVIIRQGKGRKDRYSILSEKILELLRRYFKDYRPKKWLFEGQFGEQYSATSVHNILKAAVKKSGIRKKVTVHTLRHCFATHLLEHGVDLRYIQELLGHRSPKTTEIYTHITQRGLGKIKSPLDNLDI